MFQHRGIWLPDGEEEFAKELGDEYQGKATYQLSKFQACLPYIKDFKHAVDVGAHVGLWSRVLADKFERVTAFEPNPHSAECLVLNAPTITWSPCALGSGLDIGYLSNNGANSHIADEGTPIRLASLDYAQLRDVSFIKIDAEGYELPIVRGAEKTIRRDKPTMIIEQKEHPARYGFGERDAVDLVCKWGAEIVKEVRGDYICRFP